MEYKLVVAVISVMATVMAGGFKYISNKIDERIREIRQMFDSRIDKMNNNKVESVLFHEVVNRLEDRIDMLSNSFKEVHLDLKHQKNKIDSIVETLTELKTKICMKE